MKQNWIVVWRFNDKTHETRFSEYAAALAFALGIEVQGLAPTIHEVS